MHPVAALRLAAGLLVITAVVLTIWALLMAYGFGLGLSTEAVFGKGPVLSSLVFWMIVAWMPVSGFIALVLGWKLSLRWWPLRPESRLVRRSPRRP